MKRHIYIIVGLAVVAAIFWLLSTSRVIAQAKTNESIDKAQSYKFLDATRTQSIAEWTNAIPNFKLSHHFRNDSSWVMAQMGETNFPKVTLTGASGSVVQYPADFINIEMSGDQIQRIDLHSPKMNVDDLRQLGNQLLQLISKDKTEFNAWCDKVGNRWMDQPEYSSGNAQVPNSGKSYGFSAHPTFDDKKPWYIYFVIADK